ncbi:methylated-DNA--[protein]-cysteine S-methyltransferase [Niabella hibiscisoli]|uniref:methylated-DNA--[protein]-cysteine S-methyltransferase n=1 Tax=Niabella hibiscisoli TaxID=1825928 RepID=UPI001F0F1DFC|nr:methylated-DNA--[protein]-cysteine S-methyltransferase [Niabella hibiscisoli]MCH5717926.1 methylated-DNA--[protein]-cysteine S-methyltransferase [Niabella hibiscisoli]
MEINQRVVYKDLVSPVGLIRLIASGIGLMAVLWEGEDYTRTKLPGAVRDDEDVILMQAGQQLEEYFTKQRKVFDIPLDLRGTEFQLSVWNALLDIPYGVTKTYGALARKLGDIKAVRAVGGALNKNPVAVIVPCHRVVGASGKLVGFAGGLANKYILLDIENGYKMPKLF